MMVTDSMDDSEPLIKTFELLGALSPEVLAKREGDYAELSKRMITRRVWDFLYALDSGSFIENTRAATKVIEAGGRRSDLVKAMQQAAFECVSDLFFGFNEGLDADLEVKLPVVPPSVALFEIDEAGEARRQIWGIDESLLADDPTGNRVPEYSIRSGHSLAGKVVIECISEGELWCVVAPEGRSRISNGMRRMTLTIEVSRQGEDKGEHAGRFQQHSANLW